MPSARSARQLTIPSAPPKIDPHKLRAACAAPLAHDAPRRARETPPPSQYSDSLDTLNAIKCTQDYPQRRTATGKEMVVMMAQTPSSLPSVSGGGAVDHVEISARLRLEPLKSDTGCLIRTVS